jgi:hypothetical protein
MVLCIKFESCSANTGMPGPSKGGISRGFWAPF